MWIANDGFTLNNSVVRTIGFTVLWGMADGVFTNGKDAIDVLFVLLVVSQVELHLVNSANNFVPSLTLGMNRWPFLKNNFFFPYHDQVI